MSTNYLGSNAPNFRRTKDGWENLTAAKNAGKIVGKKLRKKSDDDLEEESEIDDFDFDRKLNDANELYFGEDY